MSAGNDLSEEGGVVRHAILRPGPTQSGPTRPGSTKPDSPLAPDAEASSDIVANDPPRDHSPSIPPLIPTGEPRAPRLGRVLGGPTDPADPSDPTLAMPPDPTLAMPADPTLAMPPDPPVLDQSVGVLFVATTTTPGLSAPVLERLLDGIYRWRTALGVGLAATMTVAVVVAFWGRSGPGSDPADPGLSSALGRSNPAAVNGNIETLVDLDPDAPQTRDSRVESVVGAIDDNGGPAQSSTTVAVTTATPAVTSSSTVAQSTTLTTVDSTTVVDGTTTSPASTTTSLVSTTTVVDTTTSSSGASSITAASTTATASTTVETSAPASTASSSTTTVIPPTVKVEAETGTLLGTASVRNDHAGFSGTGFVGDIISEGSGVELQVDSPTAGLIPFAVYYSAGVDNGPPDVRTLSVLVNGEKVTSAQMAVTRTWTEWAVVTGELDLLAGLNLITLIWNPGDTGWVNIDYVQLN